MIFKDRTIRFIFLISLMVVVFFLLVDLYFIHPSFTQLLVHNTEEDARRTAKHLASMYLRGKEQLTRKSLARSEIDNIEQIRQELNLLGIKIYSPLGEVIYSSDPEEIGEVNRKKYFHEIVAGGSVFSESVKKDTRTLEGKILKADVVETYVPVMEGGEFKGAFELYYDITGQNREIGKIHSRSDRMPIAIMSTFMAIVFLTLLKLDGSIERRKKAEMAITAAKNEWEQTFDTVPDLIMLLDNEFTIKRMNRAMANRFGVGIKKTIGAKCYEIFHQSNEPVEECPHQLMIADGKGHSAEIFDASTNSYFHVSVSPIYDSAGKMASCVHVARDITQRKLSEEELLLHREKLEDLVKERTRRISEINEKLKLEIKDRERIAVSLRESERNFRSLLQEFNALLEAIPDTLILLSRNLEVLWTNKGESGINRGEDVSDRPDCYSLWNDHNIICADCVSRRCFQSGEPQSITYNTADGSTWDVRAYPVHDEKGDVTRVIEIATDVSEKVALQREAVQSAHLASIGQLAAGVAHEINNPINGIINYAQMIINNNRNDPESTDREIAERIIKEGTRIAVIVRSLLSFARVRKKEKLPVHIGELLDETLSLTGTQLKKDDVMIEKNMSPDIPAVTVNPQQIQQVFLNITNNARHALNDRYPGKHEDKVLKIRTSLLNVDGSSHVRIEFTDHGIGIDEGSISRITEPFFTTKAFDKGTGLGLSISYGIVNDHGGKLSIKSEKDHFTTVFVDLPVEVEDSE